MSKSLPRSITVLQRSRPLRFGYLLRGLDDIEELRNGIQLYTSLWGGMYSGFIPVYRELPSWWTGARSGDEVTRGYLDAFEPDYLVSEHQDLLEGLDYDRSRILLRSELVLEDADTPFSYGLGVHELFAWMWKNSFQYVQKKPLEVVVPSAEHEAFDSLIATCFGDYPTRNDERRDFGAQFRRIFDAKDMPITGKQFLDLWFERIGFPLNLGAAHLEVRRRSWITEPRLHLLDATSPTDLVDFWNLRALGMDPIPVPVQWFDEFRGNLGRLLERSRQPHHYNADLLLGVGVIRGRSLNEDKALEMEEGLSLASPTGVHYQQWYPRIWDAFGRDRDHALRAEVTASNGEAEVALTNGHATFRACPLPIETRYSLGRLADSVRVVRIRDYLRGSDLATVIPRELEGADKVVRSLPPEHVWFSSEGLTTTCLDERRFLWKLPRGTDICVAWLKQHGFSAAVTSGGKLMQRAVRRLGGLDNTVILANEPLVRLLNRMSGLPDRPRKTYNNPTIIGKLQAGAGSQDRARSLLRMLVDRRVLEVGVRLGCEQCGQRKNWYALDAIGHSLQCHRCLQRFPFPSAEPPRQPWYYRTIGAFAVEDYIQGAVSVMLAMRLLVNLGTRPHKYRETWSPSLKLRRESSGHDCEIDAMGFVAQSDPYRDAVLPVFVEGKSYGSESEEKIFREKDIDQMRRVGTHCPGAVLAFATLSSMLHPSDIELIKPLAEAGRTPIRDDHWQNPVVVLTGLELFSERGPPYCWQGVLGAEKIAGRAAPMSLFDLADVTQQLHLKMRPRSEYIHEWLGKRLSETES